MKKAEEKVRTYTGPDADMLQASRVMHGIFTEDKAAFTAFDDTFADPFAAGWLQKIEDCSLLLIDSSYVNSLAELTKKVDDKMEECRSFFSALKYFVEKAFPGRKEIWARFGFNDYESARKSQTKMMQFLGILSKTADEYKNELIAAGFSQEKIDQINTLQTELTNADYEQELSKKKRPVLTQNRIENFNECYSYMQKVSKAGKIIFASDRAKYEQYLLPNERAIKPQNEPAPPES